MRLVVGPTAVEGTGVGSTFVDGVQWLGHAWRRVCLQPSVIKDASPRLSQPEGLDLLLCWPLATGGTACHASGYATPQAPPSADNMHTDLLRIFLVLSLASCMCTVASNYEKGGKTRPRRQHLDRSNRSREGSWELGSSSASTTTMSPSRLHRRQVQELLALLRQSPKEEEEEEEEEEGGAWAGTEMRGVAECCPSVQDMVPKVSGKNREGLLVKLFSKDEVQQSFLEVSCRPDVVQKPCKYLDRQLVRFSTCLQRYSYTYALVVDPTDSQDAVKSWEQQLGLPWRLDYIKVRSGCECVLKRKKRRKNHRRGD